MNIGKTIKLIRKQKRIPQFELANEAGISQTYLSQIENGSRTASIEVLEKICFKLNVPFPIVSFLSLEIEQINIERRNEYQLIDIKVKQIICDFFNLKIINN